MGPIRLFLALVVATDHARAVLMIPSHTDVPNRFELGVNAGYAVMYFYVISGFLMSYVLKNSYSPTRSGTLKFYQSRFIRIFSLYWPMMILALSVNPGALTTFLQGRPCDTFTGIFLFGIDWNLAFGQYPTTNWGASVVGLQPAWTLGAELTFYILAPFILRSRVAMFAILGASAIVRLVMVHKYGFDVLWTYQFFPATVLFFVLGAIARDFADMLPLMKRPIVGVTLLAAVPLLLMVPHYADWDTFRFWLSYLCFAAAMPAVFACTKDSAPLNALGGLSYPLYMTHDLIVSSLVNFGLVQAIIGHFGMTTRAGWVILASTLTIALAAAYSAHKIIENRTATLMRAITRTLCADFRVAVVGDLAKRAGAAALSSHEAMKMDKNIPR